MSYLDDVLAPSIRSAYTSRIESEARELEESVQNSLADAAGAFEAVSLAEGEGTPCPAGTQLLFRSGTAAATAALTDLTTRRDPRRRQRPRGQPPLSGHGRLRADSVHSLRADEKMTGRRRPPPHAG